MQNLDIVRNGNRIAMIDCENEALCDDDIMTNARLIAAAPDLLAALESLLDVPSGEGYWDVRQAAKEKAYAAITKARGNPDK